MAVLGDIVLLKVEVLNFSLYRKLFCLFSRRCGIRPFVVNYVN